MTVKNIPLDRAAAYTMIEEDGELRLVQDSRKYTINGKWMVIKEKDGTEFYRPDDVTWERLNAPYPDPPDDADLLHQATSPSPSGAP